MTRQRKLWLGLLAGLCLIYVISRIIADPETAMIVAAIFFVPSLAIGLGGHIYLSVAYRQTGHPAYRPSLHEPASQAPRLPRRKVLYPPMRGDR